MNDKIISLFSAHPILVSVIVLVLGIGVFQLTGESLRGILDALRARRGRALRKARRSHAELNPMTVLTSHPFRS